MQPDIKRVSIALSNGGTTLVNAEDEARVRTRKWGKEKHGDTFYARATDTPRIYLHQFLMPGARSVDHRDRDGLNNSRDNLRDASARTQVLNRKKPKHGVTSRYRGVHREESRQKWVAEVGSSPRHFTGRFDFETEAALVRDREVLKAYGTDAILNFPRGNPTSLPKVLFVGFGRSGKDTAAMYLAAKTELRYTGSFSWQAIPFMAEFLSQHPMQAWETRHQHREVWKARLDYLRKGDETFLAEMALAQGEVSAGLRDKAEIDAVKAEKLFDHILWIHRRGIPVDPTVTFGPEDCDLELENIGTLAEFYMALDQLIVQLKLPLK